jgi:excisionase family DNA binding protein
MNDELVIIKRSDLAALIRGIMHEELRDLRAVAIRPINTTLVSDEEVASRMHVSVSTVRRMKRDGRLNSVPTAKGRMVRVCDIEEYYQLKNPVVTVQ